MKKDDWKVEYGDDEKEVIMALLREASGKDKALDSDEIQRELSKIEEEIWILRLTLRKEKRLQQEEKIFQKILKIKQERDEEDQNNLENLERLEKEREKIDQLENKLERLLQTKNKKLKLLAIAKLYKSCYENELSIEREHARNMDKFYRQQFPYDSSLEHVRNELSR